MACSLKMVPARWAIYLKPKGVLVVIGRIRPVLHKVLEWEIEDQDPCQNAAFHCNSEVERIFGGLAGEKPENRSQISGLSVQAGPFGLKRQFVRVLTLERG